MLMEPHALVSLEFNYVLKLTHFPHVDIDECTTRNHSCSHICINRNGGYECDCRDGFVKVDNFTCRCKFLE